jgi:response regulator RpfG family c-di-GMP phosphodiesterase
VTRVLATIVSMESGVRLVVLMIEVEQPEGISARKLLLETARHNVITAYGGKVGLALLRRFPNVDVVVVHTELADSSFDETVNSLKALNPRLPVIGITPVTDRHQSGTDYMISSHDPQTLLALLSDHFDAALSPE